MIRAIYLLVVLAFIAGVLEGTVISGQKFYTDLCWLAYSFFLIKCYKHISKL